MILKKNRTQRPAKKIIAEDAQALMERFKYLAFQPLMANLSERAEKSRQRELKKILSKIDMTDDEHKLLEQMTRRIVRKLLRMPMMKLNASAGTDAEIFYTQAVKALFTEEASNI